MRRKPSYEGSGAEQAAIMDIASLIAVMAPGDSISSSVTESMVSMGANNITVGLQQKRTSTETTGSGMGFSVFIGVFFGYYPANKAAKLDPIEAFRYE